MTVVSKIVGKLVYIYDLDYNKEFYADIGDGEFGEPHDLDLSEQELLKLVVSGVLSQENYNKLTSDKYGVLCSGLLTLGTGYKVLNNNTVSVNNHELILSNYMLRDFIIHQFDEDYVQKCISNLLHVWKMYYYEN